MLKRLKNNCSYIWKSSLSKTGIVYVVLGFLSLFVSFEEVLFKTGASVGCKVVTSLLILLAVWLSCFVVAAICVLCKKKRKLIDGRNGKAVYVLYGDLLSEKIVRNGRRNICFAVNRCFDTIVDDCLIAAASVHGCALRKLYDDKAQTPEKLNAAIQQTISSSARYDMLSLAEKPQGNLKRYEVGTAVDIPVSDKLHYFMVGLSALNADLKAETTRAEYCQAIQKTIEFCDAHAQGQPVLMPVIGGFLSRTGQSEKDLLRYIINGFELNKDHINQDVYIVIRESAKNKISIVDL